MVRGSGYEPGTDEPRSKHLYDGTIHRWDVSKMQIKSTLFQKGLWNVVKNGPQCLPAYEEPINNQPTSNCEYYYALQDNVTQGPVDYKRMLAIINTIKEAGHITPDSILIFHHSVTNNQWEGWSDLLTNKIAIQGSLVNEIGSIRLATSTSQSTVRITRGIYDQTTTTPSSGGISSSTARTIDFGSPLSGSATSARDREIGQQRDPTPAADNAAFHVIVSNINANVETGSMLLLDIDSRFGEDESGHLLFKFLDQRATCGASTEGLISADEQRTKIRDWKFCANQTITVEAFVMGASHFKRMWQQQPKLRQGIAGDMFDAWKEKLPSSPFHTQFIPSLDAFNALQDGSVHGDYDAINNRMRALYVSWLKDNPPVKGKGATNNNDATATALVTDAGGKGKGKGKGKWGGPGGGGKGKLKRYCFRCWTADDHLSGTCPQPPGVCVACGMDSDKARMSCGGEQDPSRCIIKGFRPDSGLVPYYKERLQGWANDNGVKFVEPAAGGRALATSIAPTSAAPPASTVGPMDSVSVVGGQPTALSAINPGSTTWRYNNGSFQPVGGSMALVAPTALVAYGGRPPLQNEIDVVVDGACTTIGTVPTADLLTNLRQPEIPGMFVGNNQWCPATASGDLVCYTIDSTGQVAELKRTRHVVPELKYHLHGETAEFNEHGGVVRKDATLTLALPNDTELLLLPGADDMVRLPAFSTYAAAQAAANAVFNMHHKAVSRARQLIATKRAEYGLVGQAISKEQADKFLKYHAIFGCKGDDSVHTTLANSTGHGSVQVPRDAAKSFGLCEYANTYKNVAMPHHDSTNRATFFGEKVLVDDLGPFPEKCIVTGAQYARKFTDEATGFWAVYPVIIFNANETVAIIKQFMGDHAQLLPAGKTYTTVRTDGGSVLRAEVVRDLFDSELIQAQASMPRQPEQMGQNESAGREMVRTGNASRARARDAGLPCGPGYAILAIQYAADLHNHTFTRTWRGNTCPIQLATGKQPNVSALHCFGAVAYSHITSQERPDKLSANGIKGQFIGLARGYNGAKLLIKGKDNLQQAGASGIRPAVLIHEYTKLGIDIRVDDAPLYLLGRKLLPTVVDSSSISTAYPRTAPEPPAETDPIQAPPIAPDEGAPAATTASSGDDAAAPKATKPKPRKTYTAQRPDGSKWTTRHSTNTEAALIAKATESDIPLNNNNGKLDAYYSSEETIKSMYLSDIPESQWDDDDLYALVHFDEHGHASIAGEEVQRHPYLVHIDAPGVEIESVALMAKVGDDADGVHVFSGRSDISNEADAEEWIKARGREVDQLRSMPTWKHVKLKMLKRLGIKPVRTMFVDKVKRSDTNKIVEFKSRGVACQVNAMVGRDFRDKFWHVARDSSLSFTLGCGTIPGVKVYQIDLPGFYLSADPGEAYFDHDKEKPIFVSMLPGYKEYDDDGDEAAGVLTRAMYGTAIAGRAAGRKLAKGLQDDGYERGVYDRAVYRKTKGDNWIQISCVVDDMVVADYGGVLIHELVQWLQLHWGSGRILVDNAPAKPIKFGPIQWCLGRKVDIDEELGIVMVSGQQYIEDMERKYMTADAIDLVFKFKADIPTDEEIAKLSTVATRQTPEAASLTRSLVQSLAYCGTKFKHEIMYHVGRLQRFADNPCIGVYVCALQMLKYCIRDKLYGIAWSRCDEESTLEYSEQPEEVFVSVDSSWQVHDKSTRSRSTTGMVFFWRNGPVAVRSNGQRFQAISSTDAEAHGLASAMYEGIVVRGHAKWAGIPLTKPTRLENDNTGAVLISRDASSMHNSRASAMRAIFCQECVEEGMFDPVHVPAEKMTADVLTKWLPLNAFSKHRSKLTNRRAQIKMLESKEHKS